MEVESPDGAPIGSLDLDAKAGHHFGAIMMAALPSEALPPQHEGRETGPLRFKRLLARTRRNFAFGAVFLIAAEPSMEHLMRSMTPLMFEPQTFIKNLSSRPRHPAPFP